MNENQNGTCRYSTAVDCWKVCRRDCGWHPSEMVKRMLKLRTGNTVTKNGLKTLRVGRKNEQEERN